MPIIPRSSVFAALAATLAAILLPQALAAAAESAKPISAQELDSSIPAQDKINLKVPPNVLRFKAVSVDVLVHPNTSAITVYGYTGPDRISAIPMKGGENAAEWPFVRPKLWVKCPPGTTYQIFTLGYRD